MRPHADGGNDKPKTNAMNILHFLHPALDDARVRRKFKVRRNWHIHRVLSREFVGNRTSIKDIQR